MGSLVSKLVNKIWKPEIRILMMGLPNSGKTTILNRLAGNAMHEVYSPTQSFNVEHVTSNGGVKFTLWDVGGNSYARVLRRHYYHNADGLIYVVDSSDGIGFSESISYVVDSSDGIGFSESISELQSILRVSETRLIPIVFIANKRDRTGAVSPGTVAEDFQLSLLTGRYWCIHSTCAKTGEGLTEAMTEFLTYVDKFKNGSPYTN